jgi:hypothetical protein
VRGEVGLTRLTYDSIRSVVSSTGEGILLSALQIAHTHTGLRGTVLKGEKRERREREEGGKGEREGRIKGGKIEKESEKT